MKRIALIASATAGLALLASAPARADWVFTGVVWDETNATIIGTGTFHNFNNLTVGSTSAAGGTIEDGFEESGDISISGDAVFTWQGANAPSVAQPRSGLKHYESNASGMTVSDGDTYTTATSGGWPYTSTGAIGLNDAFNEYGDPGDDVYSTTTSTVNVRASMFAATNVEIDVLTMTQPSSGIAAARYFVQTRVY